LNVYDTFAIISRRVYEIVVFKAVKGNIVFSGW